MRRTLGLLLVGMILAFTTSAGLAYGPTVDGQVTQKFTYSGVESFARIAVEGTPYDVPQEFYLSVQVGYKVHFDGTNWTITSRG